MSLPRSLQISLLDLLEATDQVTDWYMLGVYLKLPRDKLTEIERQFSGHGARRCKTEMFDLWMKLNPDASWELIVLALEKCGETALAEHVRERHLPSLQVAPSEVDPTTREPKPGIHHQQPVSHRDQQYITSTVSTPAAPAPVKILVGKERVKQFTRLERSYASLSNELQSTLEEKQVSLVKLKRFLNELLRDEDLLQAASIDEVFRLIKPHYCFLNTTILEAIIEEFVGEPLKQKLEKYENQLEQFTESTELSVLKEVGSEHLSTVEMPQVILKMAGYLANITIKRFQVLVSQFFETESSALANIHVKDGCICVSWFARRSAIPGLVALAQQKVDFMRHVGVLRLSVGDTIIMEQTEEDNDLHSLLLHATTADCAQAVEFLLSIEADPNCTSENGDTPLIIACRNESISIANMLLTAHANVNLQNKEGCTALIVVCCAEVPNESLVRMLVQAGAEVNILSSKIQVSLLNKETERAHVTALILAARHGHTNIVQYLLDEGADVNKLDKSGSSALMYASTHGHAETVRLLLNYGADVSIQDDESITALHYACGGRQSIVCVELLLANGADPNIQAKEGTPLIFASYFKMEDVQKDPAILAKLLSVGANPNIQAESDGATALILAAATSYQEGVEILLNAEASVNLQNSDGYTALHAAAGEGNLEIVELLLASGAQASVITNDGDTPLDLALDDGHDDVCQLLITSMESDPCTSQLLEHRQGFQQSSNPASSTTQDTHSSEHPQHQPHRSVQTTRTRSHHRGIRSLSTMQRYFENILLPDRAIKRREANNNSKQDLNTSKFKNHK